MEQALGPWTEYSGIAKANWGRLTHNDLTAIGGSRDLLIGKLQVRYGLTKDQAEQQVDDWLARLAVTGSAPAARMAGYLSGPVYDAGNELTKAAAKSIRQHPALVFGVTAVAALCWVRAGSGWPDSRRVRGSQHQTEFRSIA